MHCLNASPAAEHNRIGGQIDERKERNEKNILRDGLAFGIRESAFKRIGGRCVRGIPYAAAF